MFLLSFESNLGAYITRKYHAKTTVQYARKGHANCNLKENRATPYPQETDAEEYYTIAKAKHLYFNKLEEIQI